MQELTKTMGSFGSALRKNSKNVVSGALRLFSLKMFVLLGLLKVYFEMERFRTTCDTFGKLESAFVTFFFFVATKKTGSRTTIF